MVPDWRRAVKIRHSGHKNKGPRNAAKPSAIAERLRFELRFPIVSGNSILRRAGPLSDVFDLLSKRLFGYKQVYLFFKFKVVLLDIFDQRL